MEKIAAMESACREPLGPPDPTKPTALFIIDRVKHWSSRAWMSLNSAIAYRQAGGRVILLVDCPVDSNRRVPGIARERLKPEMILERAREAGLTEFLVLPIGRKNVPVLRPAYWGAIRRLAQAIDREHIDVLHLFRRAHHLTASGAAMLARRNVAVVRACTRADRTLEGRFPHFLFNRRLDAVTAFSRRMTEANRRVRGIDASICHEIAVALPQPFVERARSREEGRAFLRQHYGLGDGPVVGLIGAVEWEKRPENLVRAAGPLLRQFPGLTFLLVGEQSPGKRAGLDKLIEQTGVGHAFRIHPPVDRAQVPTLLAGLDVGLYLSCRSSGPSRMVLEYLSQGVPTVATTVGTVAEYHARDPHAFVAIPPDDIEALAGAIAGLLRLDEAERADTARRAIELVRGDFTLERLGARLSALYHASLEARGIRHFAPRAQASRQLIK